MVDDRVLQVAKLCGELAASELDLLEQRARMVTKMDKAMEEVYALRDIKRVMDDSKRELTALAYPADSWTELPSMFTIIAELKRKDKQTKQVLGLSQKTAADLESDRSADILLFKDMREFMTKEYSHALTPAEIDLLARINVRIESLSKPH